MLQLQCLRLSSNRYHFSVSFNILKRIMLTNINIDNEIGLSDVKPQTIKVDVSQSPPVNTLNYQNTLDQKIESCSIYAKPNPAVQSNMLIDNGEMKENRSEKKKNILATSSISSNIKCVSLTTNVAESSKKLLSSKLSDTKNTLSSVKRKTSTVLNQKSIKKDSLILSKVNLKTTRLGEPFKYTENRKVPTPLDNKRVDTIFLEKEPLSKRKNNSLILYKASSLRSESKHAKNKQFPLDTRSVGHCIAKSTSQNVSGEVIDKKPIPDSNKKIKTRNLTHLLEDSDRKAEKMKSLTLKEKERKEAIGSLLNYCSFVKTKTFIKKLPSLENIKRDPLRLYNEETLKEKKKKQLLLKFEIDLKRENEAIKECTFQPNLKKKKYLTCFTQRHPPFIQGSERFLQKQMMAKKMQQSSMERELKLFGSSTRECLV